MKTHLKYYFSKLNLSPRFIIIIIIIITRNLPQDGLEILDIYFYLIEDHGLTLCSRYI